MHMITLRDAAIRLRTNSKVLSSIISKDPGLYSAIKEQKRDVNSTARCPTFRCRWVIPEKSVELLRLKLSEKHNRT